MTREGALLVMVGVAVVLLGLMAWGWWRRTRRDAQRLIAPADLPAGAVVLAEHEGLYLLTTPAGRPLERLAAPGLGFRSRARIIVADAGIALDMPGQQRIVLPADRLVDVDQTTVAVDNVVERNGLVRVRWRTDLDTMVDTYLRPQDASAAALARSIRPLLHNPRTGTAA